MKKGKCHICGNIGDLSFEHIPPKKAFNNKPVIVTKGIEGIVRCPNDPIKGSVKQRGMGSYTLCEHCNNYTGSWYGSRFVDWCYQGMDILMRSDGSPSLIYLYRMYLLAILKQIVVMFLSVNSPDFGDSNPALVKFVLDRYARGLLPIYRFFTYYNIEGIHRSVGLSGSLSLPNGNIILMSEISYPPFGYLMTIESKPPDKRLFEITHFTNYDYDYLSKLGELRLPVLPTHLGYPGDYRTKDEIYQQADQSKHLIRKKMV